MTTFNITTDTNIDACAGGTGGHSYQLSNRAVLTIDQDFCTGVNSSDSNSIERIGVAVTGGTWLADARAVRLIPFVNGSGTLVPGDTITCGSATGVALAVYTALDAAPALTGASGWIKVKQWNSVAFPTSGTYTQAGFTFDCDGADIVGWIELLADEGTTAEPGLAFSGAYLAGTGHSYCFEMRGEWFELGDTNGSAGQTFQIPTNGRACYVPGIFIEETDGAGDFEFWPNVADATAIGTEAARGKVCWIANTGVVTIGHNGSTAAGYTPGSGLRVVVGNIFTSHCTAAARTANVIPNATLANRFQIGQTNSSSRSAYVATKANICWYLWLENASSVTITSCAIADSFRIYGANAFAVTNAGVGVTANVNFTALYIYVCLSGGALDRCRFWVAQIAGQGKSIVSITGSPNVRLTDIVCGSVRNPAANDIFALSVIRCASPELSEITCIGGALQINGSTGARCEGMHYAGCVSGGTGTSYGQNAVLFNTGAADNTVEGIDFLGLSNVHPYTAVVYHYSNARTNRVISCGSYASPLSLGSSNACGYLLDCSASRQGAVGAVLQRAYVTNSRSSFVQDRIDNLGTAVWSSGDDYAQAARPLAPDADWRGVICAGTLGTSDNCTGTHFWDAHTSTTAGRLILLMHTASAASAPYVTFTPSATAYFNGANCLYLQAINDTCTWEDRVFRIGHTGFGGAPVMAGGTASNYLIEYSIDINDGTGWSDFEEATEANLEANNASIDAALGFKLKVRITCDTANTSAITSVYFGTTSTTTTQAYQYKIYETPVTVHCIDANALTPIAGCVVYVDAGTGGEYTLGTEIGSGVTDSSGNCVIILKHDATQQINGVARKSSATPFYRQGVLQATIAPGVAQTLTIAMTRED